MGKTPRGISRKATQTAIPIILKYDLLRRGNLRNAVHSALSAEKKDLATRGIKQSRWEIILSLFEDYLRGRTTVVSDIQAATDLAKATVRRCLRELEEADMVGVRPDEGDRRRRIVFLRQPYREIADRFVEDCAVEFEDLIELHDNSERRKAEAHTRAILENALDAIVTIDREGRIVGFNPSAERIFGHRASRVVGRKMADLIIPPALRKRHNEGLKRYLEQGKGAIVGKRITTTALASDGRELRVELAVAAIDEGEEKYFTAFIRDITEQKRAEEALKESENHYMRLFERAPLGYQSLNIEGKFIEINQAWLDMLGYSREEVIGHEFQEFLIEEGFVRKNLPRFKEAGEIQHPETEMRCKDGSTKLVHIEGRIGTDEQGRFLQTHCILIDITERKRIERELVQDQKMKAVGQLTGGFAHEFNNLLQVILGNLHMVREDLGEGDRTAGMIDDAIVAAKRGAGLTKQLLSFSRRQTLRPVVADINDVTLGIFQLLHQTLGEETVIKTRFSRDLSPVLIDPDNLEIGILNLVLNAHDAMPEGGTMTIETANLRLEDAIHREDGDLPAGDYVALTISDSGSGMAPEVVERAFEPFFTTKEAGRGSGLGLSMVYGFARQSGGHLVIDSEPGKGTSVGLYLPVAGSRPGKGAARPRKPPSVSLGSGTVLVVEDDSSVRNVTAKTLKRIGYEVLEAGDGSSALEILRRREDIDLVFSDVFMPGAIGGIEIAEEVSRHIRGVKVLLTSGYPAGDFDGDGSLRKRFDLLAKPYSPLELAAAVKAAIEGKG